MMVKFSSVGKNSDGMPVAQLKHATKPQIKAADKVSRTFVRRAKPKRVKIVAGNPKRRMAEVAVTLLNKTCPKHYDIGPQM
jgi:hypothetical protein